MIIKNVIKHLILITKHKWVVFKLCCKVGIPWRGLVHDLSKYSPTEFFESIKYYTGTHSPVAECRKNVGYSKAWIHHKAKNKHHYEYWIDFYPDPRGVIMPYKYAAEMICDKLAAGIIYNGKNWTPDVELNYYLKERRSSIIHENVDKMLIDVFTQVKDNGIDKTLNKKNIKALYNKYCGETIEKNKK